MSGDLTARVNSTGSPRNAHKANGTAASGRVWLVERLRACLQELEDGILVLIRGAFDDDSRSEDAEFVLGQRDVIAACLRCWVMAIERGERWFGPVPPEVDVQARRAVHNGVSLSTVLARYTTAQEIAWRLVLQEVHTFEDPNARIELVEGAWASTASLFGCVVRTVTDAHTSESERHRKTRRRRDEERVLGLLMGREDVDLRGLDYDFDGYHLGLIVGGAEAKDALRLLARALGCRAWTIERESGNVWGWLGSPSPIAAKDVEQCFLDGPHHDVKLVGGRAEREIAGFCLTHKQAQATQRVARRMPERVTWYADVELAALAMQDEQLAQSLIAAWIEPIVEQRNGNVLLRTLGTYFACAHNKAETAEAVPADRHTVERHLHRIGELIGQPLESCLTKVETALQIYKLLGEEGQRAA